METLKAIAGAAHYSSIVIAAIAGFLIGWGWYAMLGPIKQRAMGDTPVAGSAWLMVLAFLADLVMAAMLQGVIVHSGLWGVKDGIISGTFLWTGFVLTALGLALAFQGRPFRVIAIDTGHWLVVLWAMGAIIGGMGPPGG